MRFFDFIFDKILRLLSRLLRFSASYDKLLTVLVNE